MNGPRTQETWTLLAKELELPTKAIVNGCAIDANSGERFECINPATGDWLTSVTSFDENDIDAAVRAAREAFENSTWASMPRTERKKILVRLADLLEGESPTLAIMDSLPTGKPVEYALASDVPGAVEFLRWYAECVDKLYGEIAPSDSDSIVTISRELIGVVGLITPWNYPLEEAEIK